MSADHGGGGGGSGAGFFLALFACVAVAWFFAEVQKQDRPTSPSQTARAVDTDLPQEDTPQDPSRAAHTPNGDHGITYYLDEDGNILDVVRF